MKTRFKWKSERGARPKVNGTLVLLSTSAGPYLSLEVAADERLDGVIDEDDTVALFESLEKLMR